VINSLFDREKVKELVVLENGLPGFEVVEKAAKEEKKELLVRIEAIHAGTTKNFHTYPAEELKKAVETWLSPYRKPILVHHDLFSGEPVGRVQSAAFGYSERAQKECIILTVSITDPEAIQKVLDERYLTVSVGGRVERALCSVCGQDWVADGWCEHRPGEVYEGKQCTLIMKEISFYEVSFVNAPADPHAQVVGTVSEGYLYGEGFLEDITKPGVNIMEQEGAFAVLESLGLQRRPPAGGSAVASGGNVGASGDNVGASSDNVSGSPEGQSAFNFQAAELNEALPILHQQLHEQWAAEKSDSIRGAHAETVRQMLESGLTHERVDDLDDTLPEGLRPAPKPDFVAVLAKANADLAKKDEEIVRLAGEVKSLREELVKANGEIRQAVVERQQLLEQNNALGAKLRGFLAEQIVELMEELGVLDASREEVLEELLTKTSEYLEDKVKELKAQKASKFPEIENPTLHFEEDYEVKVQEGRKNALLNLFRGPGRSKRK